MMKRVTWFAGGLAAGVAGAGYAKKKVKEAASNVSACASGQVCSVQGAREDA